MVNPLTRCVEDYALPPFGSLRVQDIAPALRTAIDEMTLDLNSIEDDLDSPESDMSWESLMDRLEIIDDPLTRLWNIVVHLTRVMHSPELRQTEAELQEEVLAIQSRRAQSAIIFHAMQSLQASDEWTSLTPEQQRILHNAIQSSTLSGVALRDNNRDRFNANQLRLSKLKTKFANNVQDAINSFSLIVDDKDMLVGVPDSALKLFAMNAVTAGHDKATAANGPWKLSLEMPVLTPILHHCANRSMRERLYRANMTKASAEPHDNGVVLREIIQLRQDQAKLLGFETYAELSLATKAAPSVAAVNEMIEGLRAKSFPVSQDEIERLQAYASAHGQSEPLEAWDLAYWSEQQRRDEYALDQEQIKAYFPLQRVLDGLFKLMVQLFGVRIEAADGEEETWHADVRFFQMRALEQPGQPIVAQFFLDLYTRPTLKTMGSWIDTTVSRSKVLRTGKFDVRVPVFSLMWNQTPPVDDAPTLLSFSNVDDLFHVFGFGLRLALTSAEYTAASSNLGVELDWLDMPGSFLAKFCYGKETIKLISGHYETGEPLPDAMFDKLIAAKHFMAATTLLRTLNYVSVDMAIYNAVEAFETMDAIFDLQHQVASRFSVLPVPSDDRFLCSFHHIFSAETAASYYSYRWAEVISSDAYAAFEEAPTREAWEATGRKFRDTMLALVGVVDPNKAFKLFRGRKPNPEHLLKQRGLLCDIE
ncbi:Aste57867_18375 [Aphanomyces stellatus]|uniref:oligopeptidase A n=1 Tax=Aphanomyces stellatus TaxID=120398 RepID=A0A485L9X1_9STRA|nr:hypothetical protein As57867_018313 [Aphanomyces stellatus]VFT95111.1 Aste57867_18375 [Aphanomyces stellatus]